MSKQRRYIIITVCVLAVLLGAWLFVSYSPTFKNLPSASSAASTPQINLLSTDKNNVQQITCSNKAGKFTIVKTGNNAWNVKEITTAPVSSTVVGLAVSDVASFTATKIITKTPTTDDLKKYGLDKPQSQIDILLTSNKTYTFYVGSMTPLSDGYYLTEKGSSTVYVTPTIVNEYFLSDYLKFVDTAIVAVEQQNDAPSINVMNFGGTKRTPFEIDQIDTTSSAASSEVRISNYYIKKPNYFADSQKVTDILGTLASMTAYDTVSLDMSSANLQKYGLKNPLYTFSYVLKNQTTTLLYGNEMTDSGTTYVYFMLKGRNVIYRIATSSVSYYKETFTDVAARTLLMPMIDTVKSVTVQNGSKTWKFNLTGTGDKLVVTYDNKLLTSDYFRDLYQDFVGLQYEGTAQQPAKGSTDYVITYEYRDSKKPSDVMQFISIDANDYFWKINDSGQFYVYKSTLDKIITDISKVLNGQDVTVY